LQAPQGEPGDATTLEDTLGADDPDLARAETRAELNGLLKTVSPRSREMLRLRFEEDMTQGGDRRRLRRQSDAGFADPAPDDRAVASCCRSGRNASAP